MISKRVAVFTGIFALILLASYITSILGVNPPPRNVRPLGEFYLRNSYFGNYSAKSPEVVTSIVWDYRGLDTLFEVTVFFLAIMGGLTIFRLEKKPDKEPVIRSTPMTLIVRLASKILSILIVAVSASIALHGHLTPGGGFQGGTALAIAPLLLIVAYSRYALEKHGLTYLKAVVIRSTSLLFMWLVVIMPLLNGYYIMQNQPFYPSMFFDQLISGSLFYYNLLDYIAIGMGFTAIFLYLSIPEEIYRKELEAEQK